MDHSADKIGRLFRLRVRATRVLNSLPPDHPDRLKHDRITKSLSGGKYSMMEMDGWLKYYAELGRDA